MSKKPSVEDALRQKLNELPLPDETASWQKMKALLDEKEKRRPFLFFRNEKIVGGALLLCALLVWFALFVQKETKTAKPAVAYKDSVTDKGNTTANPAEQTGSTKSHQEAKEQRNIKQAPVVTEISSPANPSHPSASSPADTRLLSEKKNRISIKKQGDRKEGKAFSAQLHAKKKKSNKTQQTDDSFLQKQNDATAQQSTAGQINKSSFTDSSLLSVAATNGDNISPSGTIDSSHNTTAARDKLQETDRISANKTDTKADSVSTAASAKTNIKIKPRNTWFIDVGVGIKQQLPIDSQRFVSYNYNSNQSWFGDYIPFLYAKLEKEKKWFLQGEFHYAAPRLINAVPYWQKSKVDYAHSTASTSRYYLQKVWYNEVPLSLNIYIRPSWSVGAGAMYSWLQGAAVRRTTSAYDASSGLYNDSAGQMPWKGFTDSFLYRNNTSLLLQTDYQINRWSIGIRYLRDLHPYLTYTLPDGQRRDKHNASLEMMIRYRLYRSDKFRIGKL